jgi:raffinose/stachyose/melibiose transport system permease protein
MVVTTTSAPQTTGPAASTAPRRRVRRRAWLTPALFLVVPLAFLVTFTWVPVLSMFGYSVTKWDGLTPDPPFVGLDNYVEVFTRPELFAVLKVSLYYVGASFVQIGLALYFATVLSFKLRLHNLFKGILFFPYLINGVAIGMIFLYFFQPGGTLDATLGLLGLDGMSRHWLGDPDTINYSLAGTAIQSIQPELFEAAELDGANRWQRFRYLILPGIRPVIGLSFILALSGSLSVFEIPFIMTGGANGSETFVIQTVNLAFKFHKFGLASAMAAILLVIVLLITWVQRRLVPEESP